MKINWFAPINELGYGTASLNIALSLHKQHQISYFPINGDLKSVQCPPENHDIIREWLSNAQMFDYYAPCIKMWHQFGFAERIGTGPLLGFPIFELDQFSKIEENSLMSTEHLLVCSQWAKDICQENLSKYTGDIYVVPLGVNTNIFKPGGKTSPNKTIFFNAGKWEKRKGHDILIECFNSAFKTEDDVELWMLCNNPFLNEEKTNEWLKLYKTGPLCDKVKILPRVESHRDVARIMQAVDCGVFLSRGEGWNLESLEMMACGKPIIITHYSAHTEFCNVNNSMLVNIDGTELAEDGIWFKGQGNWARFDEKTVEQTVQYMRKVHQDKQDGNIYENKAGINTAQQFTWDNSAQKITKVLHAI